MASTTSVVVAENEIPEKNVFLKLKNWHTKAVEVDKLNNQAFQGVSLTTLYPGLSKQSTE